MLRLKFLSQRLRPPVGKKFGKWKVLGVYLGVQSPKMPRWLCECECGLQKGIIIQTLVREKSPSKSCRACWEHGPKNILNSLMFYRIKSNASKFGRKFSLSKKALYKLFLKQNGICALSGEKIILANTSLGCRRGESTASLDRIDNAKGYIPSNVQWVHKRINYMKHTISEKEFIFWCRRVSKFN